MHQKHYFSSMLVLLFICVAALRAQASAVEFSEPGFDFDFVLGDKQATSSFTVSTPGTYKASLVDFEAPAAFDILSLAITEDDYTPLGKGFGTETFTFSVATPGTLLAHLRAVPKDGGGLYALQVLPIPIPPAFWLFLSAMIGIVSVARHGNARSL